MAQNVIEVRGLRNVLGGQSIHDQLDLSISAGSIVGIIGSSGSGKTTLLRSILMLQRVTAGSIKVLGTEITTCTAKQARDLQRRWGVTFQQNALFSGLTVLENVMFPLREFTDLDLGQCAEIALLKLVMAGLSSAVADKYPVELSGGMRKRAALARAIALDPQLLFLDEPTSGLDPNSAGAFDELIIHLQNTLGLTIVMVTHDLDSLWYATDQVAFIGDGKVLAVLPMPELVKHDHVLIKDYFSGPRSVEARYQRNSE